MSQQVEIKKGILRDYETVIVMAAAPVWVDGEPEMVRKFQNNEDGQYEAQKLLAILKEYGNNNLRFYIEHK